MRKILSAFKRFWRYYILGYYHCDNCPFSWEEGSYDGDWDCGCHVYGDTRETCRLLPPFRFIIGSIRKKVSLYHYYHAYDGIVEFYEKDDEIQKKFEELFCTALSGYSLAYKGHNGEYIPFNPADHCMHDSLFRFRHDYEEFAHPFETKTYRQEIKDLMSRMWKSFVEKFKPYFCK